MLQDLFPSSHIVTFTSDPRLPSHMLLDGELVRLCVFQVLNAPLRWPGPAKWLLSTAAVLGRFRLVSARGEQGVGVRVWGCGLDWLTLRKGQLDGMRGEELTKWLFSLFFFFLSPLVGAEALYGYLWACGRASGAAVKPTSPLCCEGWAEVPVIGSVLSYIYMHMQASTLKLLRPPTHTHTPQEQQGQRRGLCCEADL